MGQRKGLKSALGHPVFVTEIRPETNEVVIGENEDVFSNRPTCRNLNWMSIEDPGDQEMRVSAKDSLQPQRGILYDPQDWRRSGGMRI